MKKKGLLYLFFFFATTLNVKGQISTCAFYDGYWGEWKKPNYNMYKLYGNYSGFIVYYQSDHPSEYIFKFQIESYSQPSKEAVKYHWKNEEWYEYYGYVEYFIDSSYPTIKTALKTCSFALLSNNSYSTKKTANATIKIAPYKDHPRVYNIFFEDIAIAIDLCNCRF